MTYKQAFDKITEAYIKGEIKPYSKSYCVCGNLSGGREWSRIMSYREFDNDVFVREYSGDKFIERPMMELRAKHFYSGYEYYAIEDALLTTIKNIAFPDSESKYSTVDLFHEPEDNPKYEEALFKGMCAALEVLKQIHISRGETIDETAFIKRELVNA